MFYLACSDFKLVLISLSVRLTRALVLYSLVMYPPPIKVAGRALLNTFQENGVQNALVVAFVRLKNRTEEIRCCQDVSRFIITVFLSPTSHGEKPLHNCPIRKLFLLLLKAFILPKQMNDILESETGRYTE